ncbi:MAG: TRAP transporter small permease [Candidatus Anaerobiospirillum merdipullorum]|uniref:TRAP transporter small permease protein n=1 Tax=Candidatus Anaerobiospirillum merdipullorum TaxID=2838450 RepID=A0A9E2NSP7_9GAMM|nr:TRAP transporter small permease [Candidatus Anaerobiospirillum merdipullorum]
MNKNKILCNLDLILAGIAFTVLVAVTFGGVIFRYLLSSPIMWAEEVQLWCFLWITFLGAGAAFRYGSHVAVEIVFDIMPPAVQKVVTIINYVIVMGILVYLLFLGADLLSLMLKIHKTTAILRVPMWFINGVIPVGCITMMISTTYDHYLRYIKHKSTDDTATDGAKEA